MAKDDVIVVDGKVIEVLPNAIKLFIYPHGSKSEALRLGVYLILL